jgi:hypothetical protein
VVRTLRAEELAGDVEGLAADDDDLLAVEELLGDDAGQAAKQVALAIDHDLCRDLSASCTPIAKTRPNSPVAQPPPVSLLVSCLHRDFEAAGARGALEGASIGEGEGGHTTDSNEDILPW